jgi:hypothetical protein
MYGRTAALEERDELLRKASYLLQLDRAARALKRVFESLLVERRYEIVDGRMVERGQRMLIERRDEDRWRPRRNGIASEQRLS